MDRTKLNGRPMFVSPSVDKSKNPTQFKVSMRFFSFILSMHRKVRSVTRFLYCILKFDLPLCLWPPDVPLFVFT